MSSPRIQVIPRRPAVCSDATVTLDLLVKIEPPRPEGPRVRPALNLALVLDRSGSMAGAKKIEYARQAATLAVRQLLPEDRVSITIFDDRVETIAANAPVTDQAGLVRRIEGIHPRGATNLHGGWAEGAAQAQGHRVEGGLNRVLLLSDGLANAGLTDPNAIAVEVKGALQRGVGTSTLGLGDDYNEDLLEAMAGAGDGNYYYVESPAQLTDLFQTELQGLMATVGRGARLGVEPGEGVVVADVLNDLDRGPGGALALPNLVVGMPVLVLVRLNVPARSEAGPICTFRLSWDDPEGGPRGEQVASYDAPEVMPLEWWTAMPEDASVVEQEALLMSARAQKEAAGAIDRGDVAGSRAHLDLARTWAASAPSSPATEDELRAISGAQEALEMGAYLKMSKMSKFQSYSTRRSRPRPQSPEPPEASS
jgi:Ca-activated chloride channel family protein